MQCSIRRLRRHQPNSYSAYIVVTLYVINLYDPCHYGSTCPLSIKTVGLRACRLALNGVESSQLRSTFTL